MIPCETCDDQQPAISPLQSDLLTLHRAMHRLKAALVGPFADLLEWLTPETETP